MYRHAGPGGLTFVNIEHAGKHTLQMNCDNFPQTTKSYILPPLFISTYPEGHDPISSKPQPRVTPPLSCKEQKKFDGICSGQGGEQTEYRIFNMLNKLLEKAQVVPILILRNFELDTKGKTNFKQTTLKLEYPHIKSISMRGELDYIVLLKDLGFVTIEVKGTFDLTTFNKAKDQLDRSELFLNQIMSAVALNSHCLPVVKMIMFEIDPQNLAGSSSSSTYNVFNCNGGSFDTFSNKLEELKQKLRLKSPTNTFNPSEFKRLTRLITGLWTMKSLNRQPYFDVNEGSLHYTMARVDDCINHAHLSSDVRKTKKTKDPPVTDVMCSQEGTVFRDSNEISLTYLTPQQKNLYDNMQRGIIRGPAGTGKTLLTMFKIIDLVQSPDNNREVLLFAPHPHTIRCKNILIANNITTVVETEYFSPVTPYSVVIIDQEMLIEYSDILSNFSSYHIFIDDNQNFSQTNNLNMVARIMDEGFVERVLIMLNKAYEVASENTSYFWIMVDEGQDRLSNQNNLFYSDLFSIDSMRSTIPVYTLAGILRNTEEICKVVLTARQILERENIKLPRAGSSSFPPLEAYPSHKIKSSVPKFHQLLTSTKTISDNRVIAKSQESFHSTIQAPLDDFVIERIKAELQEFFHSIIRIPLSGIAILLCNTYKTTDMPKIRDMLLNAFNIIPMSIEDQLESCSATIVLDSVINALSAEWTFVILLLKSSDIINMRNSYTGISRARTRLVIIDEETDSLKIPQKPLYNHDVNYVGWKRENNQFVRV